MTKHTKQDETTDLVETFLYLFAIVSQNTAGGAGVEVIRIVPTDLKAIEDALVVKSSRGPW